MTYKTVDSEGPGQVELQLHLFNPKGHKPSDKRPATVEEFKQRMVDKGLRCDLHIYENQPHEFYNFRNSREYYTATVIETDLFLESLGFLQGEPTLRRKRGQASFMKKRPDPFFFSEAEKMEPILLELQGE